MSRTWRRTSVISMFLVLLLLVFSGSSSGTDKFKVLYSFPAVGTQGSFPSGPVVFDEMGNLYGTTYSGGNYAGQCRVGGGCGVVYELSLVSGQWKEKVLHAFDWVDDGDGPVFNLVLNPQGDLYGVVGDGPPGHPFKYNGAVFKLTPGSNGKWSLTLLYKFPGGTPHSGYVIDAAGNLYGNNSLTDELSSLGGGQWQHSTIAHDFGFATSTLKSGHIYNTGAGKYVYGSVYQLTKQTDGTWQDKDLYDFTGGSDGEYISAGVVFDAKGNIYGATRAGGTKNQACGGEYGKVYGCGVIYELSPQKNGQWKETVLHRFYDSDHGYGPATTLTIDKLGNLYGTCPGGTGGGLGVLFEVSPGNNGQWTYSIVHTFSAAKDNGSQPSSPMIFDQSGKHLYGTTPYGGAYNGGTLFEYTP